MKIGSLFSGIGGLELGLERAGVGHTVWQVEQNEYCRQVLATHWPDAARYEDVKGVGAHNLAAVDVICGGFPCQDISDAGTRVGLDGDRSGLWYEFARIVRDMGPRYVVVENVAALLGRGMGAVLGTLADLGYDAEWSCVQAIDVGAPHRRDRVFLIAYAVCEHGGTRWARGSAASVARESLSIRSLQVPDASSGGNGEAVHLPVRPGRQESSASDAVGRCSDVPDAERGRRESRIQQCGRPAADIVAANGGDSGRDYLWRAWESEPDVGRLADGIPARLVEPELTALGNAVVPQVAEVVGCVLLQIHQELTGEAA